MITSKLQSVSQYKDLALSSKGFKQSIISLFGSMSASFFSAITLILLSRFLGPSYFGQFSTAFALGLILIKLNDLGLSTATSKLVPVASELDQKAFLSLILKLRIAIGGLIIVFGVLLSQLLSKYLIQDNSSLILLAFLLSFATTVFEHVQFSLQAQYRFKLASTLNALQGFLKLLLIIPFILLITQQITPLNVTVVIIFIFYMLAPAIPIIILHLLRPDILNLSIKLPSAELKKNNIVLNSYLLSIWKITKHAGFGILALGIIENIDILFVQGYLSNFEAGLLGAVSRIALLLYVVAYALANVMNPRVAKYQDWLNLHKFWKKAWLIVACCVLGFVLSMFMSPFLITHTIGNDYLEGINAMRILLGAGFLTIAVVPFVAMFYSYNLIWYFSVSGLVQLIIILLGNAIFVPIYGLEASAWTRLLARLVLLLMTIVLARWQMQKRLEPSQPS